jgi:magnesium transporter
MKLFDKRYHQPGTTPATLMTTATVSEEDYRLRLIDYTPDAFEDRQDATPEDCRASLQRDSRSWLHVQGSITPTALEGLGELVGSHGLALEDVINVGQRPKIDLFDDHVFIVMALPAMQDGEVSVSQVSIFLGKDYLMTFCAGGYDPFEPVRKRLHNQKARIRAQGIDYLLHAVVDVVVDESFPVLESLSDRIEALEAAVLSRSDQDTLNSIHVTKRELLLLRRMLWPHREVITTLLHDDQSWIGDTTRIYMQDCYDHIVYVIDMIDNGREMTSSLVDVHLSNMSNRLNEVMRVLTIIATIFIPLSFIVGVYGMNFSNENSPWSMPELEWYYGYPLLWLVMIAVVLGMLIVFKRKGWL